eukprot:gene8461-10238_t
MTSMSCQHESSTSPPDGGSDQENDGDDGSSTDDFGREVTCVSDETIIQTDGVGNGDEIPLIQTMSTLSLTPSTSPPTSRVEEVLRCGYLTKRGGLVHSWKRRYFVLTLDGTALTFTYYKSVPNSIASDSIMTVPNRLSTAPTNQSSQYQPEGGRSLISANTQPLGSFRIAKKQCFRVCDPPSSPLPNRPVLQIFTEKRVYQMYPDTEDELREWVWTIERGIEFVDKTLSQAPTISMSGLLKKKGKRTWARRWFQLSGTVLQYFSAKEDSRKRPLGTVVLQDSYVYPRPSRNMISFQFFLTLPHRQFLLAADDALTMQHWLAALEEAGCSFGPDPFVLPDKQTSCNLSTANSAVALDYNSNCTEIVESLVTANNVDRLCQHATDFLPENNLHAITQHDDLQHPTNDHVEIKAHIPHNVSRKGRSTSPLSEYGLFDKYNGETTRTLRSQTERQIRFPTVMMKLTSLELPDYMTSASFEEIHTALKPACLSNYFSTPQDDQQLVRQITITEDNRTRARSASPVIRHREHHLSAQQGSNDTCGGSWKTGRPPSSIAWPNAPPKLGSNEGEEVAVTSGKIPKDDRQSNNVEIKYDYDSTNINLFSSLASTK